MRGFFLFLMPPIVSVIILCLLGAIHVGRHDTSVMRVASHIPSPDP